MLKITAAMIFIGTTAIAETKEECIERIEDASEQVEAVIKEAWSELDGTFEWVILDRMEKEREAITKQLLESAMLFCTQSPP
jgi:hypothetical protein